MQKGINKEMGPTGEHHILLQMPPSMMGQTPLWLRFFLHYENTCSKDPLEFLQVPVREIFP